MPLSSRRPHAVLDALLGAVLGLGAPAGWLAMRWLSGQVTSVARELASHPLLYAYLTVGTALAFGAFGIALGLAADRLAALGAGYEEQAMSDPLTGLRNRRYFQQRLVEECARMDRDERPLSLVAIDLDHFKGLNDRRGHAFGDWALERVAKVIAASARASDVAARTGGEEFAVICPATAEAEACRLAERIRSALESSPVPGPDFTEPLTASLGVAEGSPGDDWETLYSEADRALYRAKAAGRNRWVAASGRTSLAADAPGGHLSTGGSSCTPLAS